LQCTLGKLENDLVTRHLILQLMKNIIEIYLKGLETGNTETITDLFSENGIIHSPLYGTLPVKKFYKDLFADTAKSVITLLNIFESSTNSNIAAAHFKYHWTLKDGTETNFEAVDIFNFNTQGKIEEMTIIYDTAKTRSAFEKLV
jgi:hypothetical protein